MKEKQKTVYYCDFCKKYKLMAGAMTRHESSCTMNRNRICRVRGCEGDCPWCQFSKFRLGKDFEGDLNLNVSEAMQEWWAKKGQQWVMSSYDHVPF